MAGSRTNNLKERFVTLPFVVFLVGFMAIYLIGLVVSYYVDSGSAYVLGFVAALIGSKLRDWAADWQQTRREVQSPQAGEW